MTTVTFLDLPALRAELRRDEGLPGGKPALKPYRDTVGKLTIGYGRNLDDVGIEPEEADWMLDHDIAIRIGALHARLRWFDQVDPVRQRVLINMAFMGVEKLLGFHKMLAALMVRDYETAARELLDSKYATQVGQRAVRLAHMLRTGTV